MILYYFFFAFALMVLLKLMTGNRNYIYFSRWVTWVNSFKRKTPNPPIDMGPLFISEYKIDGKAYGIMFRKKRTKFPWTEVGACVNEDKWLDITKEAQYWGGFYRDFHMKDVRPVDINEDYQKMAFRMNGETIHVEANEVIVNKLREFLPT